MTPETLTTRPARVRSTDSLRSLLDKKGSTFRGLLHHLRQEIDERTAVSRDVAAQVEEDRAAVADELLALETWPRFGHAGVEQRRLALEQRLLTLHQERRHESVACWRDVTHLTRELRQWLKQYADFEGRYAIVAGGGGQRWR